MYRENIVDFIRNIQIFFIVHTICFVDAIYKSEFVTGATQYLSECE